MRGVPALGGKLPAYARKSACAAVRGADSGRKADWPPLLKIPAHLEKATHAIRQAPLFGWAMVGGILWSQQALAFQIFYDSLRRAAIVFPCAKAGASCCMAGDDLFTVLRQPVPVVRAAQLAQAVVFQLPDIRAGATKYGRVLKISPISRHFSP